MSKKPQAPQQNAPFPLQGEGLFGEEFWKAVDAAIEAGLEQKKSVELPPELLEQVVARPVNPMEVEHLQQIHAYLVLTNGENPVYEPPAGKPYIIRSNSGWLIHDYGPQNYIVASAGLFAYGYHPDVMKTKALNDDEGETGSSGRRARKVDYGRTGTIVQQIVDTSKDMIGLVQNRWPSAKMVDGYAGMQRMAWVVATLNDYPIVDFEPTIEDRVVLEWATRNGVDKMRVKDLMAEQRKTKGRRAPGQHPTP